MTEASPARAVRAGFAVRSVPGHVLAWGATAVMLALAFPEPGWGGFVFVALVPAAVAAMRSERPWRLAWTSYVVGLGWWLLMIRWMTPVTVPGWLAFNAYLAVYWPIAALLWWLLARGLNLPGVLAVPLVWTSLELIRSSFLSGGFGWLQLGHAVVPIGVEQGSRLMQVADLFGEWGVSFLVGMTSGLIVDVLTRSWSLRRGGWRGSVALPALIWAVAFAAAAVYGGYRLRQPLAGGTVRVGVIQTAIPQSNKDSPAPGQEAANWQRQLELARQAAEVNQRPQLVVLPETTTPDPVNSESLELSRRNGWLFELAHDDLRALSQEEDAYVVVGSIAAERWTTTRQGHISPKLTFNSTFLYRPDGEQDRERYDKIHRVPFGEYIPWVEDLPWLKSAFFKYLSPYDFDYTVQAGRVASVFEMTAGPGTVRFVSPICFEDTDGPLCRRMVYGQKGEKQADLIVNPSNEAWFGDVLLPIAGEGQAAPGVIAGSWLFRSYERQLHLQMAALRCVENRVPMARSVNSGLSGFIDSNGRVVSLLDKPLQAGWLVGVPYDWAVGQGDLRLDGRQTIYGRIGNVLGWSSTAWTGVLMVIAVWTGRGRVLVAGAPAGKERT